MMVVMVMVMVMVLAGRQAQRVGSEQWRWVVHVARVAQAQRVGSHEAGGGGRGGDRRHLGRGDDLLEQRDVAVRIHVGSVAPVSTGGHGRGRRRAQQRIQAYYVGLGGSQLGAHFLIVDPSLLEVVDEMATGPVRAETDRVKRAAQLGLVFRMAGEVAQLAVPVSELTLVAIFAGAAFLEWPAQLCLVPGGRLARAAIQFTVLLDQGCYQGGVATKWPVSPIVPARTVARGVCRGSRCRFLRLRRCVL